MSCCLICCSFPPVFGWFQVIHLGFTSWLVGWLVEERGANGRTKERTEVVLVRKILSKSKVVPFSSI